jgi:hypothetical protein
LATLNNAQHGLIQMLNYFGDLHTCLNKEVASKFDELKYNINSKMLGINFNFEL